ncbi:MAG: hypothetical protein ABMB14_16520 [Myxococcota bacterium]
MILGLVVGGWWSVADAGTGSEISHSRGKANGVVVLWPRVVPETDDPAITDLAKRLQARIQAAAATTVIPARIDVRPAPERVCPLSGCRSTSVGVLLGHQDGGCAALAIVGPPGVESQRLVPLAGKFQMTDAALEFRAAPEGKVTVSEFVPCASLEQALDNDAIARLLAPTAPQTPAAAPAAPAATPGATTPGAPPAATPAPATPGMEGE